MDAAAHDVHLLVERARRAQPGWAELGWAERARRLRAVRAELACRAPELADAAAEETGKPPTDALFEVAAACVMAGWVAANARRHLAPRRVPTRPLVIKRAHVQYAPLGVIGVIAPWNYPIGIPFQSLPYAVGAGNAVVLKPSELTPRTGRLLASCFEPLGPDVVVLAEGDGAVGGALVTSGIDKLVFTGSPGTARRILAAAAEPLLPVVLELGGKDALIVCDDADLDHAAAAAVGAAFANAGQTCMAAERVLVHADVHDELVRRVVALTGRMRVGRGADVHVGPVTRPEQLDVVERRVAAAVATGARVLAGGRRLPLAAGLLEPTVLTGVDPDTELWREESFAPVLSIMPVAGDEEALAVANASAFGLTASVHTRDRARAARIAARLEVGGVNVNDAMTGAAVPGLPFGGVKGSGYGRLQGPEGLRELSRVTSVVEPVSMRLPSTVGAMFTGRRPSRGAVERAIRALYGRRRG